MTWAEPQWLLLLPLVAVIGAILAFGAWRQRLRWGRRLSSEMERRNLPGSVRARRAIRDVLLLGGLALLLVALAEPRFGKVVRTVRATGTDLVLVLDLSRSMDAQDVDPSRLERARREITDLGNVLEGDRVGLVFFAGGAYPRLPLTVDYAAVETVVGEADTSAFQTQGSDLGSAIRTALELLERSPTEAGRALIVLSDGETHDPEEALAAAAEAAGEGVAIFAMGIGVEPAPIPMPDGRLLEWEGQTAITTPDFGVLEQVARETGGAFVRSQASPSDMRSLYAEIRATVRAVERDERERETWRSTFQWPLGAALLAMLLGSWLGDGRRRFGAAGTLALAALSLTVPGRAVAQDLHEADRLYRDGKFEQAAEALTELSLAHPGDADLQDRLGAARYRAGDPEGAFRAFEAAARLRGGHDPDTLYNSGNAAYEAGRLENAIDLYDKALAADAEHKGALQNKDLVQKEIEARRAVKPPPPPPTPSPAPTPPPAPPPSPSPPPAPDEQEQEQEQAKEGEKEQEQEGESEGEQEQEVEQESGPITEGQARQLLESVEEGRPRTVTFGRPEDKPW